jgi:hypothetical protein
MKKTRHSDEQIAFVLIARPTANNARVLRTFL